MSTISKTTFSRVLVPLDGSLPATTALKVGEQLADRWGADLQVITLIEKSRVPTGINHLIEKQLARINLNPKVEVRPISFGVAEDIAGEFDSVDDTFVVMSSWARGRSAGLLTNVAEDVFRLVRQPMLLTGTDVELPDDWPSGPLLICVDGSHFSEAIIQSAVLFAKGLSMEVSFVSVVDSSALPAGANPVAESNFLARLAGDAQVVLGREVNYDVLHGPDPAEAIADYANHHGASAIAMATHVRSGISRLTHGSVAMDVVSKAHCPVLIDRPSSENG
ncbi:MAG: universal stress protein [Acidimicrobiales bacterium]